MGNIEKYSIILGDFSRSSEFEKISGHFRRLDHPGFLEGKIRTKDEMTMKLKYMIYNIIYVQSRILSFHVHQSILSSFFLFFKHNHELKNQALNFFLFLKRCHHYQS